MISTTNCTGICFASNSASGFVVSRRNAAEIAGSTKICSSAFCFLEGCSKSSVAGRFLKISSPSMITPLMCDVLKYCSIRFERGPAAFVLALVWLDIAIL